MKTDHIGTEAIDPRYAELDAWSTEDMLAAMYEGQLAAVEAVRPALPALACAVEQAAQALAEGGRIVYVGAGTSGRIGVQDGAELVPTFNWAAERLLFLIAGGTPALTQSIEGAEDSEVDSARAVAEAKIGVHDVVIGTAASGTTPYTVAALRAAQAAGAVTIGIAGNANAPLLQAVDHPILVQTGSEVIAGSTRMKAGTAQKVVLNLFSTAVMVKLGRIYRGMMVQMRATNAKLGRRATAIVSAIAGCPPDAATRFVEEASGDVKLAILLARGLRATDASRLLGQHNGNLRAAIDALGANRHV
ncbi:MAG TPA: N-acetylmuramic acid 6-phosphate etherase [Rhizomicrobium sp.]|jgi:N-acetylmuramic acid 6-phosphate etherase